MPDPVTSNPTIEEVDRIAALRDPVLRNLLITQSYHELSLLISERLGRQANWCTFATWASKQAGQTIRRQDLSRAIARALEQASPIEEAVRAVASALRAVGADRGLAEVRRVATEVLDLDAAVDRSSAAVAEGNLEVFAEIAREFVRFCRECLSDAKLDGDRIARFCARLRPGDPPDGQRHLRLAFTSLYGAGFASEPRARAELLLLSNLRIGFHEQTRLQPRIAAAVGAALPDADEVKAKLIRALFPGGGWLVRARLLWRRMFGGPTPLDLATARLVAEATRVVRKAITEHMMVLELPRGVVLRLGDDLRATFPASLTHPANAELLELLAGIDPTPDSLRETGAVDWADLAERMHYLADFFRCYHESTSLFDPPFTPEQVAIMRQGQVPAGRL